MSRFPRVQKSPKKSPGYNFSKTPAVSIKNLKILPIYLPALPDSTSTKSEKKPTSPRKEIKKKNNSTETAKKVDQPQIFEKVQDSKKKVNISETRKKTEQGPLSEKVRNLKEKGKSSEATNIAQLPKVEKKVGKSTKKSTFTVTSSKNKDSKVTVLKMSDIVALSRQEEALEKQQCKSDLERMLEGERERKAEEAKRLRQSKKEAEKVTVVAKKSPVKPKMKSPEPEADDAPGAKIAPPGRRNSLSKTREQWVVTPRLKSPSPSPTPFVARKSRPEETVSFSLPAGGFRNESNQVEPKATKSLPWFAKVDDLFSQYYPDVDKNKEVAPASCESETDIAKEEMEEIIQETTLAVDSAFLVRSLLEDLLECSLPCLESWPVSSARSRDPSGDSSRSGASSSCGFERTKSQKQRRRTEDLGKSPLCPSNTSGLVLCGDYSIRVL